MGELGDLADRGEVYYRWVRCVACGGTGFPPRVYRAVGYRSCPHCGGIGKIEFHRGAGGVFVADPPDLPDLDEIPPSRPRPLGRVLAWTIPIAYILAVLAWIILRRLP